MLETILTKVNDGFVIMLIGMGVVFGFLTLMVFMLMFMSAFVKFIGKFFPEEAEEVKAPKQKRAGKEDEEIAVAIAVATRSM